MRSAAAVMVLLATFIVPERCFGQNYTDAIGNVPDSVKALKFGMSFVDVQRALPGGRALGSSSDPRSLIAVYFKPPEVWDTAGLEFINGKLEVITFSVMYTTPDVLPRSVALLERVIDRNGPAYARWITLASSKYPIPTRVWMKEDFQLFAVGPSAGVTIAGKEIFPIAPQLLVGIARKTKPIAEFADLPGPDQLRDLLFKAVSPVVKE